MIIDPIIGDIPTNTLLVWAVVGAVAGWLSGIIVKGRGFGLIDDIVVGIIGAFVGDWLLPRLGVQRGVGLASPARRSALPCCCFSYG